MNVASLEPPRCTLVSLLGMHGSLPFTICEICCRAHVGRRWLMASSLWSYISSPVGRIQFTRSWGSLIALHSCRSTYACTDIGLLAALSQHWAAKRVPTPFRPRPAMAPEQRGHEGTGGVIHSFQVLALDDAPASSEARRYAWFRLLLKASREVRAR